jgi:hypothetical protein
MHHNVEWLGQLSETLPDCCPHAAPDAIALYRDSQDLAHRETYART